MIILHTYDWKNHHLLPAVLPEGVQYNNFVCKKDKSKVNLYDAYARTPLGIRL